MLQRCGEGFFRFRGRRVVGVIGTAGGNQSRLKIISFFLFFHCCRLFGLLVVRLLGCGFFFSLWGFRLIMFVMYFLYFAFLKSGFFMSVCVYPPRRTFGDFFSNLLLIWSNGGGQSRRCNGIIIWMEEEKMFGWGWRC